MKKTYLKKEYFFLLAIFIIAFLIRLYFALNNKIITEMGIYYLDLAKNLILNQTYTCNYLDSLFLYDTIPFYDVIHPPMLPLFIASSFSLFGIGFLQAKMVNVFLGSVLVVLIYFFAKQLFDKKIALASSTLAAFFAPLIIFSSIIHAETLVMVLIIMSFTMFLYSMKKNNQIFLLLSAIFYGLSVITKTYMSFFFPLFILAFFMNNKKKVYFKKVLIFSLIAILIILPWVLYTHKETSEFSPLVILIPSNLISEKNNDLNTQELIARSNIHPNEVIKQTLESTTFREYLSISFKNAFMSFFLITPIVVTFQLILTGK